MTRSAQEIGRLGYTSLGAPAPLFGSTSKLRLRS